MSIFEFEGGDHTPPFLFLLPYNSIMKKILTIALLFFFSSELLGQISPNAKFFDALISFNGRTDKEEFAVNSSSLRDTRSSNLDANFNFGFAASSSDMILIGFSHDYNAFSYEIFQTFDNSIFEFSEKTNFFSMEFAYEKFIFINDRLLFSPRIGGSVGIGRKTYEQEDSELQNNMLGFSIFLSPRLQYFLDDRWALTGSIGNISLTKRVEYLNQDVLEEDPKNKELNVGAFFGANTFGIGVRYYFNNDQNVESGN